MISPFLSPGVLQINSLGKFGRCEPAVLPDRKACEAIACDVFDPDLFNNIWFGLFLTMMLSFLVLLIGCIRQG
jgi:hypothetical protein